MADMSKLFGYNDATMTSIIDATALAIGDMNHLNGQVQQIQGYLPTVNNSTSGKTLAAKIDDWTYEFSRVVNALDSLKEKAEYLRRHNVDTSYQADQAGAQG